MDIAQIHVGSYATRIAQVAAAEIFEIINDVEPFGPRNPANWFDPELDNHPDESAEIVRRENVVEAMGDYVCERRIEVGETLYRHAVAERLVADQGDFLALPFEQRQPWETFVSTCRHVHGDLIVRQAHVIEQRRQAEIAQPAALAREDSIFEEIESLGDLRPEAVEASRISAAIHHENNVALPEARAGIQRALQGRIDRLRFNGADPARFDHDGDGRPGGSKSAIDKSIERHARKPERPASSLSGSGPGQPLSVGEAPVKPPVNRGGRGRKKTK
jgi:hypothetical protein